MADILVNKGDLKNIRDITDKMLKSGVENLTRYTQFASYESEELSERQKRILKYVENNPGTIKEGVIKKNQDIGSRMTIAKLTKGLIEMRMLIVRRDDSNQRIQHLYTNNEHVILALINDLEFFKQVYFTLIDETSKKLKELWTMYQKQVLVRQHHSVWIKMWDLVGALLMPYKNLIIMYITEDLLLCHERPLNKETLHKKFIIVGGGMKEIQTKLYESIAHLFSSEFTEAFFLDPLATFYNLDFSLCSLESGLSRQNLISFLRIYSAFRLDAIAETVLDILWKISYPVLTNDLTHDMYDLDPDKSKDWRNMISGNKEFNYMPRTTQAKNLGKLLR